MGESAPTLSQHYLQVEALTKIVTQDGQSTSIAQAPIEYFSLTSTPVLIFIVLMTLGGIGLLITQASNIKQYFLVIFISLLASLLPLGMDLSGSRTQLRSRAAPAPTPQNVIVSDVTPTSFKVSWITPVEDSGALRVRPSPTAPRNQRVIHEATTAPSISHSVVVSDLEPGEKYYFEILAGTDWYDNQGLPLEVVTSAR